MRTGIRNLNEIKNYVGSIKGKVLEIEINKGRNRIVKCNAIITEVYPSMFIISPTSVVDLDRKSFSYNDVLCGDIKFIKV